MDRQRLADALAYDQARRRRLASFVPMPADGQPEVAPTPSLRSNVENLSIGLGEGLTNQLEGVRALITDPIGTAKGTYEAVRGVVRDPSVIAQALREMGSRAVSGPLGAGEVVGEMLGPMRGRPAPDMLELDVYHGTPHRFPATEANPLGEFDASKIGTGEGAQAYGHGVYLAEDPRVATEYKNKLGMVVSSIDNKPTQNVYEEWAVSALKNFPEPEKAKAYFQNLVDVGLLKGKPSQEMRNYVASVNEAIDRASGKKVGQTIGGSLYKADLPDEMIDRMLDWDKPLSEQSAAVQSIARKVIAEKLDWDDPTAKAVNEFYDATGADLYQALESKLGSKQTSDYFREAGLPGVRYLDAGSRGQGGSGTRNFVVFPGEEKKVKILERK